LTHDRTQWDSRTTEPLTNVSFEYDAAIDPAAARSLRVVVVGAGAFGGWTALHLLRAGADVTLVDAWGPANARSSSGGVTRAIRGVYGSDGAYVAWTARALQMWRAFEAEEGSSIFRRTGVLWMVGDDDRYVRTSLPYLTECGLPFDELDVAAAAARFPQINFDGVEWALVEHEAGFLYAATACGMVRDRFVAEGGTYLQQAVRVGADVVQQRASAGVTFSDGTSLDADRVVFACGSWLADLFPGVMGNVIVSTRQEVYYMGTPAGDARFDEGRLPVWIDFDEPMYYGFPATSSGGFKIGDDTRGVKLDPTTADRSPTPEGVRRAQQYIERRFPALADAPMLEARVCQYANTPDGHFVIDRHPGRKDVWLVGGGSGHGFKLGPVVGEYVARCVVADGEVDPFFSLTRFAMS
jgi:sarcosine oxidase